MDQDLLPFAAKPCGFLLLCSAGTAAVLTAAHSSSLAVKPHYLTPQSRTGAGRVLRKVFPVASNRLAGETTAALAGQMWVGRCGTAAQTSCRTNSGSRKHHKTAKSLNFRAAGTTQTRQPSRKAVV